MYLDISFAFLSALSVCYVNKTGVHKLADCHYYIVGLNKLVNATAFIIRYNESQNIHLYWQAITGWHRPFVMTTK